MSGLDPRPGGKVTPPSEEADMAEHPADDRRFTVRDAPDLGRFELVEDGEVIGVADYVIRGDTVEMPHTTIRADRRGEGLGDVLVAGAVADLTGRGLRITASCWFVADYLARHPELARTAPTTRIDG